MTELELARAYGMTPGSWEAAYEPPDEADAAEGRVDQIRPAAPDDEYDHWVDQELTDAPMP
jgi:hypothetical protein